MFDACDEDDYFGYDTPRSSVVDLHRFVSSHPTPRRAHTVQGRLPAFAPPSELDPFAPLPVVADKDKDKRSRRSSLTSSTSVSGAIDHHEKEYGWSGNSAAMGAHREYEEMKKLKRRPSPPRRSKSVKEWMFGAARTRRQPSAAGARVARAGPEHDQENTPLVGKGWVGTLVRSVSLGSRKRKPKADVPPLPKRGAYPFPFLLCPRLKESARTQHLSSRRSRCTLHRPNSTFPLRLLSRPLLPVPGSATS
jgi:hypothetical protein